MNKIKSILSLLLIFAVFAGLLFGMNAIAGERIAANNNAAELAPLFAVMPEAKGFEAVYSAADPAASALRDVPATVQSIYRETDGKGYALRLATTEGYTGEPIEISFGVDAEGKITGAQVDAYPDTKDMGVESYPLSYVGQDSALADVSLVAGVTYSSGAFKNAIADGFQALIANGLVAEGVKGEEQLLRELIPVVAPHLASNTEEIAVDGETLLSGAKADVGSGAAYVVNNGEEKLLVLANVAGALKAYDAEGGDATARLGDAVKAAVAASVAAELSPFTDSDMKRFQSLTADDAVITALPLETVNSVVGAYRIETADGVFYGLAARTRGFAEAICTYYVLDENGAIAAMTANKLIQEEEYFTNFAGMDAEAYRAGFTGLTGDSFSGDEALIATATVSSNAVKLATEDVFAAFAALKENGGLDA